MKLYNVLFIIAVTAGIVSASVQAMDSEKNVERKHQCAQCQAMPAEIVYVIGKLQARGLDSQKQPIGHSGRCISDHYCDQHSEPIPNQVTIEAFQQVCKEEFPQATWNEPFPKFVREREVQDNPIVKHSSMPTYIILALVAGGIIYYFWPTKKQEKESEETVEEDVEHNIQTD